MAPAEEAAPPPRLPTALWAVPLVLLIVAVGPWPYGYYMFLRLVVCGAAAFVAYTLLSAKNGDWLGWALVGLALVYNPIFRVHFEREVWSAINLGSAVPFAVVGWRCRRPA